MARLVLQLIFLCTLSAYAQSYTSGSFHMSQYRKWYFYNDQSVSRSVADNFCKLNKGRLWEPESAYEVLEVKQKLPSSVSYVWLGLSTLFPELWYASGRLYLYSNWASTRPTVGGAYMKLSDGKWHGTSALDTNRALCEGRLWFHQN